MARVLKPFIDKTTGTVWNEGDEYDGPEKKKVALRQQGVIGEKMTNEPEGETFTSEGGYREDYEAAKERARELGLDIALNSAHDELIEAIEEAI